MISVCAEYLLGDLGSHCFSLSFSFSFSEFESQKVRRFRKVKVKVLFRVGFDTEWGCRQESYGSVATLVLAKYGSF